jgi:hypothetical protein
MVIVPAPRGEWWGWRSFLFVMVGVLLVVPGLTSVAFRLAGVPVGTAALTDIQGYAFLVAWMVGNWLWLLLSAWVRRWDYRRCRRAAKPVGEGGEQVEGRGEEDRAERQQVDPVLTAVEVEAGPQQPGSQRPTEHRLLPDDDERPAGRPTTSELTSVLPDGVSSVAERRPSPRGNGAPPPIAPSASLLGLAPVPPALPSSPHPRPRMKLATVVLDEDSMAGPALASCEDQLHLAWTGRRNYLTLLSTRDGVSFENRHRLPYRSYRNRITSVNLGGIREEAVPPSVAAAPSGVVVAWSDSRKRPCMYGLAAYGSAPIALPNKTNVPPSIAAVGAEWVVAWTGTDRQIRLRSTKDGSFRSPTPLLSTGIDTKAASAPSLCAVGDELAVAWIGTDRHVYLAVSQSQVFGPPVNLGAQSTSAPVVCAAGEQVAVAWTGKGARINLTISQGRTFGPVQTFDEALANGRPGLCWWRDNLWMAWTGHKWHINVARLS